MAETEESGWEDQEVGESKYSPLLAGKFYTFDGYYNFYKRGHCCDDRGFLCFMSGIDDIMYIVKVIDVRQGQYLIIWKDLVGEFQRLCQNRQGIDIDHFTLLEDSGD